jgi:hypothetical protein
MEHCPKPASYRCLHRTATAAFLLRAAVAMLLLSAGVFDDALQQRGHGLQARQHHNIIAVIVARHRIIISRENSPISSPSPRALSPHARTNTFTVGKRFYLSAAHASVLENKKRNSAHSKTSHVLQLLVDLLLKSSQNHGKLN